MHNYGKKPIHPEVMYMKIHEEFVGVLKTIGMDQPKEGMNRRKITLHSFRRYVKSVTATQTSSDYSEWLLGHTKSPYWTMKEAEKREIYATKIMRYLTGKNIESKLELKEKEIAYLRDRDTTNSNSILELRGMVNQLMTSFKSWMKIEDSR